MVRAKAKNKVHTALEVASSRMNLGRTFIPKIRFCDLEYFLKKGNEVKIRNDSLYNLAKRLTDSTYPSRQDRFENRWEYFLLPVKKSRRFASIPFGIMEYKNVFYAYFSSLGNLTIGRGKEKTQDIYKKILNEAVRFSRILKDIDGEMTKETVPYDIRTGKIKGRYVMESVMPDKVKEKMMAVYGKHLERNLKISEISLREYLHVAGICYKAAYGKKTEGLSDEQMYRKWADGRDCGMLSIADRGNAKAFGDWLAHDSHCGGHPFEIVFSWHSHGIHLCPPDKERPYFLISVTNYGYAPDFIKMVKALIREGIPFMAIRIENVLEYLIGEAHFTVNEYDEHSFFYIPSRRYKKLYFKYIEWDDTNIVKFR